MKIEISEGEGLDRLSILELKRSEISDPQKRSAIETEIASLSELIPVKTMYSYYYELLCNVNRKIWDLTNTVKQLIPTDPTFAQTAHDIFEWNQSRFRVKSKINELVHSSVNEQKSYGQTSVHVQIEDGLDHELLLNKLAHLSLSYDVVYVSCSEITNKYIVEYIPAFHYHINEPCTLAAISLN
jgi:hypothetical protein